MGWVWDDKIGGEYERGKEKKGKGGETIKGHLLKNKTGIRDFGFRLPFRIGNTMQALVGSSYMI